jgi:hypothetical protein
MLRIGFALLFAATIASTTAEAARVDQFAGDRYSSQQGTNSSNFSGNRSVSPDHQARRHHRNRAKSLTYQHRPQAQLPGWRQAVGPSVTARHRARKYREMPRHSMPRRFIADAAGAFTEPVRQIGSAILGGRPSGCPHRFCGCALSIKVFGRPVRDLFLAANWLRFPRTAPAPGMVAARRGHALQLQAHLGGSMWQVWDPNSGGGRIRVHARSIAGFAIVNPSVRTAGL